MLSGYRSIGVYSGAVPADIRYQAQKVPVVTCPIGNVFVSYYVDRLRSVFLSDPTPNGQHISAIATNKHFVFAAAGQAVYKYVTYRRVAATFCEPDSDASVKSLLPFGDFLVTVTSRDELVVWDIVQESINCRIPALAGFNISCIAHPLTYLNKILIASYDGRVRLVNIKSGKDIYEFESVLRNGDAILSMEQTPAKGVVALAYQSGKVQFLNIDTDTILFTLSHDVPVTCQSFRTDGVEQYVVGLQNGSIAVWDLENQRLVGKKHAHNNTPVASLNFIRGQGTMVTNAADNSIILWTFDSSNEVLTMPTMKVVRRGHSKPVTHAKFYTDNFFLTSGKDSQLNTWSLENPGNCISLGRAKGCTSKQFKKLKTQLEKESLTLPSPNHLEIELARKNDWSCIATAHKDKLTLWNLDFKRQDNFIKHHAEITALSLSRCGNFSLVGFADGRCEAMNMQSYKVRASWQAYQASEVRFLDVDPYLKTITTASLSSVRFWTWHLHKQDLVKPNGELHLPADLDTAGGRTLSNTEGFVFALSDFTLVLITKNTEKNWVISRRFQTASPITDFLVTRPDGRFLIATNVDKEITTFDIVGGDKIDVFRVPAVVTGISCAKDGRFLATCHAGQRGVCLWVNLAAIQAHRVSSWDESKTVPLKPLPGMAYDGEDEVDVGEDSESDSGSEDELEIVAKYGEGAQLQSNYITLSNMPETKWAALPKLDLLKLKNKATGPVKRPESVPFFLETKKVSDRELHGQDFEFVTEDIDGEENSRIKASKLSSDSELLSALESDSHEDLFQLFDSYGVSKIDRELRTLVIGEAEDGAERLIQYLTHIHAKLLTKLDYELCHAYISIFLNIHESWLLECDESAQGQQSSKIIVSLLSKILDILDTDADHLSFQFDQCLTILRWLKHSII